jgi:hypothetical protein
VAARSIFRARQESLDTGAGNSPESQVTGGIPMNASIDEIARSQPLAMRILIRRFVYRHPKAWASLCLAAGSWLVILGTILCAYGFWWGAGLMAVGALELWIAYRLLRVAKS